MSEVNFSTFDLVANIKNAIAENSSLVYSIAIGTNDEEEVTSHRFSVRKINAQGESFSNNALIEVDHDAKSVEVRMTNKFYYKTSSITPDTSRQIENVISWLNIGTVLQMSVCNELCAEIRILQENALKQKTNAETVYDFWVNKETALNQKREHMTQEDGDLYYEQVILPLSKNVEMFKLDFERASKKYSRLSKINCWQLENYPITEVKSSIDQFIVLLDFTQDYPQRVAIEMMAHKSVILAMRKNLITERQAEKLETKLFNKVATETQKVFKIFSEEELQKNLELTIKAGMLDISEVPLIPSRRQLAYIKSKIKEYLEINKGVSLYEQVNGVKPTLTAEELKEADERIAKQKQVDLEIKQKLKERKKNNSTPTEEHKPKEIDTGIVNSWLSIFQQK